MAQILALSVALQVFVVLAPFFMQWVVDQVLVSADRDLLVVLGLGFGLALLLQIGIGLLRGAYRRGHGRIPACAQTARRRRSPTSCWSRCRHCMTRISRGR